MRAAPPVTLTKEERQALLRWARGRSTPYRLVLRARTVLEAAAGRTNKEIAALLGTDAHTVGRWRHRFLERRLDGLAKDAPRPGRRRLDQALRERIEAETRAGLLQATPWSSRALARHLGVSSSMILRVWRASAVLAPRRSDASS